MSRFIKRHRSQFGRVSVVVLTIGALLATSMFALTLVNTASAAELTNRSVVVGDSDYDVDTSYQFQFDLQNDMTQNDGAGGADDYSFKFLFPTDGGGDPFTIPNFAAGDVSFNCAGGGCPGGAPTVSQVIENNEADADLDSVLVVMDGATITTPATITVTLGTGATQITNPSNGAAGCTAGTDPDEDADVCSITIQTTESVANPITVDGDDDTGDVLAAYIGDVTVSVTVEENLTFNIDGEDEATCEASFADYGAGRYVDSQTDPFNLDFGNISTFDAFFNTCHDLAVVTNASGGYAVTVQQDTSLATAGGDLIPDTTCDAGTPCDPNGEIPANADAWADNTESGWGYSCDTELDDDAGTICEIPTESTFYAQFPCASTNAADCSENDSAAPQIVFSDNGTANDSVLVEYKLSIGGTQPAGVYSTNVTYIATPTF